MELNDQVQWSALVWSLVQGCGISLLYDLFRMSRRVVDFGRIGVFCQDVLFFLLSAPLCFVGLLAISDGVLRWYICLGWVVGFFGWHFTLGWLLICLWDLILWCLAGLLKGIKRAIGWCLAPLLKLGKRMQTACLKARACQKAQKLEKIKQKQQKKLQKSKNISAKGLQKQTDLLYNNDELLSALNKGGSDLGQTTISQKGRRLSC